MTNYAYDLYSWKCFITVVKFGSIRQAAKELNLDASSISRRLANLSEELGVPLLEQRGRGVALTRAGVAALENFAPIVKALDVAVSNVGSNVLPSQQQIHIVAPIGYTMTIVRHAVTRFQSVYPASQFWLESGLYGSENFESLGRGVDIIISTIARENSSLVMQEISNHKTMSFATPGYLENHPLHHPKELVNHRLAGNTQFITHQAFTHMESKERISLPLNFDLMSDNTMFLMDWAVGGNGILMSSPFTAAAAYVSERRLVPVLPEWELPNNHVYAYATKKQFHDPSEWISVFFVFLKEASDLVEKTSDQVFDSRNIPV